jgi:hypothetical protein
MAAVVAAAVAQPSVDVLKPPPVVEKMECVICLEEPTERGKLNSCVRETIFLNEIL